MGLLDGINSALDSGAVNTAIDVGSQAAASSANWWDTGMQYATNAFSWVDDATGWIEDNPNTAKLLAGVAGGAAQYYSARQDRKEAERMLDRKIEAQRIAPGRGGGNLGATPNSVRQGMITHGVIANPDDRRR